jgi:hypothetical protein
MKTRLIPIFSLAMFAAAAQPQDTAAPAPRQDSVPCCEEAAVSPVTGFAECVKPRGVPVDLPPNRPHPSAQDCAKHPDLDVAQCQRR